MIATRRIRWAAVLGVITLLIAGYAGWQAFSRSEAGCGSGPCDGDDPGLAAGTRAVNPQVRVWSRSITLIMAEGGASASIAQAQAGDSVWLDRGTTDQRLRGENLGITTLSATETAATTKFYRYDGGLLRACGKAGDRPEVRCTRWMAAADPQPDRRMRAVERLLDRYDHDTGLWENDVSTWQSANALTTLIDYLRDSGDRQYLSYIEETYRHGEVARTGLPRTTGYNDDELWWALAWIKAFDLTGEARYLTAARTIVDGLADQKAAFCGGGLAWARVGVDPQLRPWTQVNAITNALYISATALLGTRVDASDQPSYRARATATWDWFSTGAGRALLDSSGAVNDHLDQYGDTCVLVDANTRWTYGQGEMIAGLVALYRITGNSELLTSADRIAAAATRDGSPFLQDGVLNEPSATTCPGPSCHDAETYKGVFVRGYRELRETGRSHAATTDFLMRQANSLRDNDDEYGFRWQGPPGADDHPNFATQAAALDALNAGS
ncbi:glycoside hydrolase family 76 protein [Nocardia sp. SYP-A9097]|uniref:glycoside hydrolase family 76 protein n=1 Tax=Nocardia sp. SYP-A9097 TaxID=2663237 RepID=UPI00129A489D|nr:glycoside hydrolase family 76 protein [Nocardia sp. SYP-A9097]